MNTFNTIDIDFSCAVIEWSKAVETEIDEKLFADEVISYNDKCVIEKSFKRIGGGESYFRLKKQTYITVGIFNNMENYTNGNHSLSEYLYDNYFSEYYKLDKETYNKLLQYLKAITIPRNESAHKKHAIDKSAAINCKEQILASERTLEILSKLEKR